EQADIGGMSFVRSPGDVEALEGHLARIGRPDIGILLKIETRKAFDNLPFLVLAAMRRAAAGVMIARGDMAVECGYERMAEIQEEILWVCEAAHMPVVWANAGAGESRQEGAAVTGRDYRRRDGGTRGVRDAQQGAAPVRRGRSPR